MSITFLRPELAAALLLIPLLWFFPRRLREVPLGLLRSVVILLVVLALMRPVMVSEKAEEHHVVIFDQSASTAASVSDSTLKMLITALDRLPKSSQHKLLWIGAADAMPEAIIKHFDERVVMSTGGGGSPLSAALTLAARSIPDGTPGAVTLISDGLATDTRWGPAVQALAARGIPVHTVALPRPQGDLRPVAFSSPEPLRVGRLARLMVEVVGGQADLRVTLRGPSGALATTETHRCFGRVRIPVEFEPQQSGFLALTAEVEVVNGGDTRPGNNSLSRTFPVQDPLRVLYVGGRMTGASEQLNSMVGHGFEFDEISNLATVNLTDLRRHDLVMLDDSPAARIPEQFQSLLARTVEDHGLGLLMSGGSAAFGPGGYHKSPLENLLPVEFVQKEEKKDPSTSLAIIIDTSGSMGGNRIILAKEVTRLAIRRLLPHDKVGIVEFYGAKRWAAPLQSAANAIDIQRALNRLDAGGGTILFPAMEEAYYGLRNARTRYKHVLVLTDAGVETGPYESLLRRMARDRISVSTVLVGPGRHSEFLVQLADWGNGRYYNASDRFNLPEIMLKQPSTARLPAYRPGSHPLAPRGGPGWWGPIDPLSTPPLAGYVETRSRPGADVVLETVRDRHPILASWRFGLGRVTALMTEPTGPGTEPWRDWPGFGPMLARVMERTASTTRQPFDFRLRRDDHRLILRAERRERGAIRPTAHLLGEDAAAPRPLVFRERAPGIFTAEIILDPDLPAHIVAGTDDAGREVRFRLAADARADVAPEQQVDPLQALDLFELSSATGGQSVTSDTSQGFVPRAAGGTRPYSVLKLWPWCLLAALLLFICEIAYRRSPIRRVTE